MQPALLVRLEQQVQLVQAPLALPEPPARMEQREPQVLPDLTALLALRVQLAWALRAPLALQELAQQVLLEQQERPALV